MAVKNKKIGSRYGRALLKAISTGDVKADSEKLTSAYKTIKALDESISSSIEFQSLLHNPIIDPIRREQVITSVLSELNAQDVVIKFMKMVLTNHRITSLPDIVISFDKFVKEYLRIVNVSVESARELGADERAEIVKKLENEIKQELSLEWTVRPDLIGGIVIRYLGKNFDGSVLGKINEMGRSLNGN